MDEMDETEHIEEIDIEAIDILIHSIVRGIYNSETVEDEDCEDIISKTIYVISDMMLPEYSEILLERFDHVMDELEEDIQFKMVF